MIPTFKASIAIEYDLSSLQGDLTAEDIADGFTPHHEYEALGLPSWDHAEGVLTAEADLLGQAAESAAEDGLEEHLEALAEADNEDYCALVNSEFYGIDPGAAGLSLALSAARTATFYACSASTVSGSHHADEPTVGVVVDPDRGLIIARLAAAADCGIGQQDGCWYIYAQSVTALHALGRSILAHRDEFDALPLPAWTDGLEEALAERD
jgi:hypothetical protein